MESRHTMMLGGVAVVVITLAVASAVAITDVMALRDSSGQALAASTVTLPTASGNVPAHQRAATPAPASVSSRPTTAELVPGPAAVAVASAPRAASVATSPHVNSAATKSIATKSTGVKSAQPSPEPARAESQAAQPVSGKDDQAKAKHLLSGPAWWQAGYRTAHRHAGHRVAQTPAHVAGHESGHRESPSSTAGSKKGQSPHSPDARD